LILSSPESKYSIPFQLNHCKNRVVSKIHDDSGLVRATEEIGYNQRIQDESNNLIKRLSKGNYQPGMKSKLTFRDVFYLRGRNGAKVFYRYSGETIEILGKASKKNESKVFKS